MGRWPGGQLDVGSRNGRPHSGHQRQEPRRYSIPEIAQRLVGGGQSGRQAAGQWLCLSRDMAQRHRRVSRAAQKHRRRPPPHARHEHSQLGSRPVHEADGSPRGLDTVLLERRAGFARDLRQGFRGTLPRIRGQGRARRNERREDSRHRFVEAHAADDLRDGPSVDHVQGRLQRPQPAGSRRGHPQFQPLHRDHAQHRQRRDGCLQPGLGRARQSSHRERRTRLGQAEGNNSHRRARAGQRHRHQLLPDATGPEREPAPPADWPRRDGVAKCALPKRRAVCLRGGGGVQRRVHGGDRLFRLRGVQRFGQGKGALRKLRRLQVGSRSAAAGHGRSARAGARPSGGCAARRQDGLGTHPSKNRQPGHAKQQRAGHRADGDHLQYHGHLTVHRAALQESLCEEQLVRRLHRAESPFGPRPQGQGTLERGRDEQAQVSRR